MNNRLHNEFSTMNEIRRGDLYIDAAIYRYKISFLFIEDYITEDIIRSMLQSIDFQDDMLKDITTVSGRVTDAHGNILNDTFIYLYRNADRKEPPIRIITKKDGTFNAKIVNGRYWFTIANNNRMYTVKTILDHEVFTAEGNPITLDVILIKKPTLPIWKDKSDDNETMESLVYHDLARTWIYTTQEGDTLPKIAEKIYGNEFLWSYIYLNNIELWPKERDARSVDAGESLKIPLAQDLLYSTAPMSVLSGPAGLVAWYPIQYDETGTDLSEGFYKMFQPRQQFLLTKSMEILKNRPEDTRIGPVVTSADNNRVALRCVESTYMGPWWSRSFVIIDGKKEPYFNEISNFAFSPKDNSTMYTGKLDYDHDERKKGWYIVREGKTPERYDYISTSLFTQDGTLYFIVRKDEDKTEMWYMIKDGQRYEKWHYIDSLMYIPGDENVVYRVKQLIDNEERWAIIMPGREPIFYDYVDQLEYNMSLNTMRFRVRYKNGQWDIINIEL